MGMKIGIAILTVIVCFLAYVSTRDGKFRYERSGVINAAPEKIFPLISNLKLGALWSPYEKMDPHMKKSYQGVDGQAGSSMEFDGNKDAGSGKLEILQIVPNQSVEIKLTMLKPFHAENLVRYELAQEANGTRFTWSMSGDSGFLGKMMAVLIDCEKLVADQFVVGISNLKDVVETKP